MAKDDFYTINSDPQDNNHFVVVVVDKDLEVQAKTYHINGSVCDCWAGNKWCRHKKMLVKFKSENLINSRRYWNHDKQKWLEQPKGVDTDGA